MIELRHVYYSYGSRPAVVDVSLSIKAGEIVAIIGPNASGKSTLARMMNALLMPDKGDCIVDGVNTRADAYHARKSIGMVFQNPEDQMVSRRILDDVAFGPLNIGMDDAQDRAKEALSAVGMEHFLGRSTHSLSGGQKQLMAIAGMLAMKPKHVVMDEPTSLLDGEGTKGVRDTMLRLKRGGTAVVLITHDMEEALLADRLVIMHEGHIAIEGAPRDVFGDEARLCTLGLEAPFQLRLIKVLCQKGIENFDFEEVKVICPSR